ncbi:MAG: hypothetical protein IT291_05750, partial [Deltaproteobacteria bacterium]|nr:hypothetical protein [Deltaproteobacteria bacterium]
AIDAASTLPPGYSIPFPKSKLNILLFGNGICCLLASAYALAVYTIYKNPFCKWHKLWGIDGELWDPKGRLPNYSYAGYFKVRH